MHIIKISRTHVYKKGIFLTEKAIGRATPLHPSVDGASANLTALRLPGVRERPPLEAPLSPPYEGRETPSPRGGRASAAGAVPRAGPKGMSDRCAIVDSTTCLKEAVVGCKLSADVFAHCVLRASSRR